MLINNNINNDKNENAVLAKRNQVRATQVNSLESYLGRTQLATPGGLNCIVTTVSCQ